MGNCHDFTLTIHHSGAEGHVYLLWPCDAEVLRQFVLERFDDDSGQRDTWSGKCFFSEKIDAKNGMPAAIIALREWEVNPEKIALLAHECLHAAQWMLTQLAPKQDGQFDEWEDSAYLLQGILKRALARLMQGSSGGATQSGGHGSSIAAQHLPDSLHS